MLEVVKYICEFFFCNLRHFIGLCILTRAITFTFDFTGGKNRRKGGEEK